MKHRVYIGTYTEGPLYFPQNGMSPSKGIYSAVFDPTNGQFENMQLAAAVPNPSWIAKHPTLPVLYAVSETTVPGFQGGVLNVLYADDENGKLEPLGRHDTVGQAPCHIAVDTKGGYLVASNYRNGNFSVFLLNEDGQVDGLPVIFQGNGNGPNSRRQDGPHAHSTCFDPVDNSILMLDLGSDTIYRRRFNAKTRQFETPDDLSDIKVPPGSGCRHGVFSKDASRFYVANELNCTVSVWARNENGKFIAQKTPFSFSEDESGKQTGGAICLSNSGKTLLLSTRSPGSIAFFSIDDRNEIQKRHQIKTRCSIPRFCCFSRDDRHVIVCGQDTGIIEVFSFDEANDRIALLGENLFVESPVCLVCQGPASKQSPHKTEP